MLLVEVGVEVGFLEEGPVEEGVLVPAIESTEDCCLMPAAEIFTAFFLGAIFVFDAEYGEGAVAAAAPAVAT